MKRTFTFLLILFVCGSLSAQFGITSTGSGLNPGIDGSMVITYDDGSKRLFNTGADKVSILDMTDPLNPSLVGVIDILPFGDEPTGIASRNGIVAIGVDKGSDPGLILFTDTDGNTLGTVTVGVGPDMVLFNAAGDKVFVANEGEPQDDYANPGQDDPEGSISIIDISGGVPSATETRVGLGSAPLVGPVRIFGPGASQAQDLEPEYIALSADESTAYVSCQENNAIAVIDVASATATKIVGLGFKDYSLPQNSLDPSNRDDGINFGTFDNLFGMYQPDAIAVFSVGGNQYLVTANEGDARDYDEYSEEERVKDLDLDPTAFPNASDLQEDEVLGRLNITTTLGDTDNDGDYDELYAYGARSFSVWSLPDFTLLYDSGNELEMLTAQLTPAFFNANDGDPGEFDNRSDDKGPEPEGLIVEVIDGKPYAFITLERAGGGVMVYDLSIPNQPAFENYLVTPGVDIAPEDVVFIPGDGCDGCGTVVVANEESGTLSAFAATPPAPIPTMGEWALFLFGLTVMTLGVVFLYNYQREVA